MKRLSLTVGIPVFNEEQNIESLIKAVSAQRNKNYFLEQIIVACDGSTDRTPEIVKELGRKNKKIRLLGCHERKGKATRLNEIYKAFKSELLLTLDGDVLFKNKNDIDEMAKIFLDHRNISVVTGENYPIFPETHFSAKILKYNFKLWREIVTSLNHGNNIYNLPGSFTMLRKPFVKKVEYPTNITNDQGYLYIKAWQVNGFMYSKKAKVYFVPAQTVIDFRKFSSRSQEEKADLIKHFGHEAVNFYRIPLLHKLKHTILFFLANPVQTIALIFMNLWVKLFPQKDLLWKKGMWEVVTSTKQPIASSNFKTNMIKL